MEAIIITYSSCKLVASTMGIGSTQLKSMQKLDPNSRKNYYKKTIEYRIRRSYS